MSRGEVEMNLSVKTYHDRETQGNVNCSFSDIVMCNQERALTAESLKFQIPCNLDWEFLIPCNLSKKDCLIG